MDIEDRRGFIKKSLLGASVFSIVPRHVLGGINHIAPSDILTKAVIGVGGMGQAHLSYENTKLVAICDVDRNHLLKTYDSIGDSSIKTYEYYTEVLERKDVDIIHIATPPHWHGKIAYDSMLAGKDVWCEKPMTRTIGEGRKVVEAAKATGRMFRLNTWFRFSDIFYGFGTSVAPIKKIVDNKLLGWPLTVTLGGGTGFNWKFYWKGKTNLPQQPIPEGLNYKEWLGPAPYKPYHQHRVHGTFRGYWDYDGGGLGDMGQHYLDPVQYILGKDNESPVSINVDAPIQHHDAAGEWKRIEFIYKDGCKIILDGENKDVNSPFIKGPEGSLYPGLKSDIKNLNSKLKTLPDHYQGPTTFTESVTKREPFALNEVNGHQSCTLVNLGIIAVRLGRNLEYDGEKEEFINDSVANFFINQPMRENYNF